MDPIYQGQSRLLFRGTCINVERLQNFQQLPWHKLVKPSNVKSRKSHESNCNDRCLKGGMFSGLTVVALSANVMALPMAFAPNSKLWIVKTTRVLIKP